MTVSNKFVSKSYNVQNVYWTILSHCLHIENKHVPKIVLAHHHAVFVMSILVIDKHLLSQFLWVTLLLDLMLEGNLIVLHRYITVQVPFICHPIHSSKMPFTCAGGSTRLMHTMFSWVWCDRLDTFCQKPGMLMQDFSTVWKTVLVNRGMFKNTSGVGRISF